MGKLVSRLWKSFTAYEYAEVIFIFIIIKFHFVFAASFFFPTSETELLQNLPVKWFVVEKLKRLHCCSKPECDQ